MRKIREVLRLVWAQGRNLQDASVAVNVARSTVREYVRRAEESGLSWPLEDGLSDAELEACLFPPPPEGSAIARGLPDWSLVDKSLRSKKGMTRFLAWQAYRSRNPTGIAYSRYCQLFQAWRAKQDVTMRQVHIAGERAFVDFAGATIQVQDPGSGRVSSMPVFVGALGASQYTYVEALPSMGVRDWVAAHTRMLAYFGGAPSVIVPDNLKAGVTRADRYEPDVNPTYLEFAAHYGLAIVPARPNRPRDKSVVENSVRAVTMWILARLHDRTFFSIADANDAIAPLLTEFNARPFQKRAGSRESLYRELDLPALRSLPAGRFVIASWKKVRPHLDYHVQIDGHYYSVPYTLVSVQLDARITDATIEVFHKHERVASHVRSYRKGGFTTVREHMPPKHQAAAGMTPDHVRAWADRVGPDARAYVDGLFERRAVPYHAIRSALGVLTLEKTVGNERLNLACRRAVRLGSFTAKSVKSILKHHLEDEPLPGTPPVSQPASAHVNVRGSAYYTPAARPPRDDTERDDDEPLTQGSITAC